MRCVFENVDGSRSDYVYSRLMDPTDPLILFKLDFPECSQTGAHEQLRLTSLGCLWCGPISALCLILSVIPGFRMMQRIGSVMALTTQFALMSFYQLSRLHYCFSNQQLHGNKGYPLWVFLVVITIWTITYTMQWIQYIFVNTLPYHCGYRDDLSFFYRMSKRAIFFDGDRSDDEWVHQIYYLWDTIVHMIPLMSDIMILLLYLFKDWEIGKSQKSKENGVWNNVLFILHRIVIITIFYQICFIFLVSFYIISGMFLGLEDTVMKVVVNELVSEMLICYIAINSFSMFMMMDHNTKAYVHFLHFLRRFGLNYLCCCCCHKMVDQQLEHLDPSKVLELQMNRKLPRAVTGSTMSPNLSVNIENPAEGSQISCDTVTRVVYDTS